MIRRLLPLLVAVLALAGAAGAAPALGAEPPNQNDPCSSAGRNTCGTTGVGSYRDYRYGIRWFGDYRRVIPGVAQAFCIDLRFWYPAARSRFEERSADGLRNKAGRAVPPASLRRMAWALWNAGRTDVRDQQAAVMLYVHALMGDGAPGEAAPDAAGPAVAARYRQIERDATRFAGPYRVEAEVPQGLQVARRATGTVRVVAASGAALPGVRITLQAPGAEGLPAEVRTDAAGVARITFTPAKAGPLRLAARTEPVASTLPRIFAPTVGPARVNGQRLAAPGSQVVTQEVVRPVAQGRIAVTTKATPDRLAVGEQSRDEVTFAGTAPSWRARVQVQIHGPFRSREEIRCDGPPAAEGALEGAPGTRATDPVTMTRPGWYTYRLIIPASDDYAGVVTPCAVPEESFRVEAAPRVRTQVSEQVVQPGAQVTDLVIVEGLAGEAVTVNAALYGPFPTRQAIRCDTPPVWSGTIAAATDGEYRTEPVTLTTPGYYHYRETIAATELVRAAETACGDVAETTVVRGAPQIQTQVSSQETRPGATITDRVVVSGLGALTAQVEARLWGPFPSREAIRCEGEPFWSGTFTANGDGTYTTAGVRIDRAGYYTYTEAIAAAPEFDAAATACGEAAETTFARATPEVTTQVQDEVVRPGGTVADRIRVSGLGKTQVRIEVDLFGPFPTRAAMRCTGTPFWTGTVTAKGDGEVRTPPVRVRRAGFYTFRERLAGTPLIAGSEGECGVAAETAIAAPGIATGRGDPPGRAVRRAAATPPTLGIDAPVGQAGIDVGRGLLDVPADIRRTSWWRDGAAPGQPRGNVLIAGHVDSAARGAGAFFRLKDARAGTRIEVRTADGRTRAYRVTGVRVMPKDRLPTDIWSISGPARLVLVTCGGPFSPAIGRYVDNVVVTAVPA
ncbi:MAG: sortase [Thermoleophilia bacterium]|nr:sortase [Thermoleophilia bacterium]